MKLAVLIHQSSEMYGSDKVLLLLAQGLLAHGEFRPIVILPQTGPLLDALVSAGIEVHLAEVAKVSRAAFTPLGILRLVKQIWQGVRDLDRISRGRDFSIVHSNTLAVLSGAVWSRLRRKRHLWHVHEILLSPLLVRKVFPFLVRMSADRVMSNSTETERWLLAEQPALAGRSVVAFNGLPEVVPPPPDVVRDFRATIGADEGTLVVTLAGRINRMKGHRLLIAAVKELQRRDAIDGLHFVVVGGPAPGLEHLPAEVQADVRAAGLEDNFSFLPFVDNIWPVWFGTDIAVVPSTEPESFGMVAIEAMAAGVPVVAAAHGGLLDIVVDGETGLLFEPRDAIAFARVIEQLAGSEKLRRSLGTAGAQRQKELFSMTSQVTVTIETYRSMLA